MLLSCVWDVTASNLGCDMVSPTEIYHGLTQPHQTNAGMVLLAKTASLQILIEFIID
jgi:hypothetical protein